MMLRTGVRIFAVILCALSVQQAWAGIWLYRGERLFKDRKFEPAVYATEKVPGMSRGPLGDSILGQSALYLGIESEKDPWYERALVPFERLTTTTPSYSRGWLYLALTRIQLQSSEEGMMNRDAWEDLKPLLLRAIRLEPGSGWVAFHAGRSMLLHEPFLSSAEKQTAMSLLEKSVRIHFPNPEYPFIDQPAPLLEAVLNFLWERYGEFPLLKSITPVDRASIQLLLKFMREQGLWDYYEDIYAVFLSLRAAERHALHQKGESLLGGGRFREAFEIFRKAYWLSGFSDPKPQAGILIAEEAMGRLREGVHPVFHEDYRSVLKRILEVEESMTPRLMEWLRRVVEGTRDDYLLGLRAHRMGDYDQVIEYLSRIEDESPLRRRLLAGALWEIGYQEKALKLLKPAATENHPDLRDLLLLQAWGRLNQEGIENKILTLTHKKYASTDWWDPQLEGHHLDRKGRLTLTLNLLPGTSEIHLFMRGVESPATGQDGFVRISFNGKPLRGAYVNHQGWKAYPLSVMTTGGKRWLQVELINGKDDSDQMPGAVVELGPVKVRYPEEEVTLS